MLLLLFALLLASSSAKFPIPFLCKQCSCMNDSENRFELNCTSSAVQYIFNPSSWIIENNTNNYEYKTLILQNVPTLTLDKQFPPSNLTYLSLSYNSIVNISNEVFSNLQKMETLVLSYNNIELMHPDAFKGLYLEGDYEPLKSLKSLHLAHNRIHSLDKDLFEHTSRVEFLDLSHNPIGIIDQPTSIAITSLVNIRKLDLSYTQLKSLPDTFLHTPKYLNFLDLSGNLFTSVPKTLEDSHNLTVLYFNDNPVVNLTRENGFPTIPSLKALHLSSMRDLEIIAGGALSNLEGLEELYCFGNPELHRFDKGALSARRDGADYVTWPPIRKLHLQDNKITSIDMEIILDWKDLVELDLTENPWTCECENQWMVDELMPIYLKIDERKAKALKCAAPIEMVQYTLYDVFEKHSTMRCLDLYGHRPERDGVLLVGILAGVLITIPIILFIIYSYQRHWFGFFDSSPAAFSRQFYKRTLSDEGNF